MQNTGRRKKDDLVSKALICAGGAVIGIGATRRRSLAGSALIAVGGIIVGIGLAERPSSPRKALPEEPRERHRFNPEEQSEEEPADVVDRALIDSFPASDPPSYSR